MFEHEYHEYLELMFQEPTAEEMDMMANYWEAINTSHSNSHW